LPNKAKKEKSQKEAESDFSIHRMNDVAFYWNYAEDVVKLHEETEKDESG